MPVIASYLDIPGITEEEIKAIEKIKAEYAGFSYGQMPETEAFILPDGTYAGFAVKFCELLSNLFGIEFALELHEWETLKIGIDNRSIDFTGDLTPTAERMQFYYMTHPIAERSLRIFIPQDKYHDILTEYDVNGLRIGYLEGSVDADQILHYYPELIIRFVAVDGFDSAARMLETGEIDVFVSEGVIDPVFEQYAFIRSREFFPLVYTPVSMATANPDLQPVISVMNKYIAAGGIDILFDLYRQGDEEYARYKLDRSFTEEEHSYLDNLKATGSTVKVALEEGNYPVCFFDKETGKFEGIAVDILAEISKLTGIVFETANDEKTTWTEILEMLRTGEVSMVSELLYSAERDGHFLWTDKPYVSSNYALLSRYDYPNLSSYQVVRTKVGTVRDSAFEDKYNEWFSTNENLVFYDSIDELFDALESGEIDLMIGSGHMLLMRQNFYQKPGLKINIHFSTPMNSYFGFNIDEYILCSIINKTQDYIKLDIITKDWNSRGYDYAAQIARQRTLFFMIIAIVLAVMLIITLLLLLLIFRRGRTISKLLENTKQISEYELMKHEEANRLKQVSIDTLESILNNIDAIIYLTVPETGKLLFVNKVMKKLMNRENDNFIGEHCYKAFRGLDAMCSFCPIYRLNENPNQTIIWEEYIEAVDRHFLHSDTYIDWPGGEKVHLQHAVDITELTQRKMAEEHSRIASEAKSRFLANMSHEIRTPMNSIIGFADLARENDIPPKTREYLDYISESAESLLDIINDILDISKIESGKMELEHIPFELHDVFDYCRTAIMPKAEKKGLSLYCYAEPSIGKKLLGDPAKLQQALLNLLSNAVKFTHTGTVKFSASVINSGSGFINMHFEVKDTGIGMSQDQIVKILEPFMQADTSITRKYGGTGLGLAITKEFLEMMGGKLKVESTPGTGSKFSFDLKFETIDNAYAAPDDLPASGNPEKPRFEGEVLVCEDNKMNQLVICDHLERVGLKAVIAENGQECVDIVAKRMQSRPEMPFDIIFMDIHMPVMDGLEAASKIIALGVKTPIVALTANVMTSDLELYKSNGMFDSLGKPFRAGELWECLKKYLPQAGAPE